MYGLVLKLKAGEIYFKRLNYILQEKCDFNNFKNIIIQ